MVGGGYTGLWTALLAKEADPSLDVLLLEGREVGWAASGRNGGFVSASLTHGYANGAAAIPDGDAAAAGHGRGEPRRHRGDGGALRHRLRLPAHRGARGGDRALAGRAPAAGRRGAAGGRPRRRVPRPRGDPGRGGLSHVPRRAPRRGRLRHRRSGPTGLGAQAGLPVRGCPDREGTPVTGLSGDAGADAAHDALRLGARGQGGARHERLPLAGAARPPVRRAGLRLRPDDRAAVGGAARRDRLAARAGDRRLEQPVPLLPADRGRPDPVGRLRRDLPLRQPDRLGARPAAGDLRRARRALLHDLPAARGAALLPRAGAG